MATMNATLFCGPEAALLAEEAHQAEARAMVSQGREAPAPTPYNLQGNVATIDIHGSLINGSSGLMSFFGYTGYSDIRDSLVAAVSDPSVNSILLNVDSGGGHVAGVHELAQLISRVDKIKPVVTYTGGTMASAALWLGSGGRKIVASETALVGSLGILQVHIDRSKQLEQDGIKATVIRAGDDKALANPYEPLTDKAKADLQTQADEMYAVFLGHVAEQRKLPTPTADAKFGGGRVFIGQQALSAGLVDQVGGYETAFAIAAKLAERSNKRTATSKFGNVQTATLSNGLTLADNQPIEPSESTNMPQDLSNEALAALAGVALDEPTEPEASTEPAALTAEALTALQASLDAANARIAEQESELAAAYAKVTDAEAAAAAVQPTLDAAVEIARASVRTMGASLGVAADVVAAMTTAEVLANHKVLAEKFKTKFRVDRVAAVNSDPQPEAPKATLVDPLFAARVTRHN